MTNVFVDSSVLYSVCYSSTGASREIIRQGILRKIKLVISKHILNVMPIFQHFLSTVPFKVVLSTKHEVEKASEYVNLKDAPILAAAKKAKVDYLVSLDTKHLVKSKVAERAGLDIVLPGEFLKRTKN